MERLKAKLMSRNPILETADEDGSENESDDERVRELKIENKTLMNERDNL